MSNIKKQFNFNSTPIWFMRQAGRYMYEYNEIKKEFKSFIEMCKNVDAVTEITLLPVRKFNFDAAIIFSDILIILDCLNIKVDFIKNKGPVVQNKNIHRIFKQEIIKKEYNKLNPVYESLKRVKEELKRLNKPLLGFAGAPWTVAAYLIEGNLTKDLTVARKTAYENKDLMNDIIKILSEIIIEHLKRQIENGADIIQVFDTHSNILDHDSKQKLSIEPIKKICKSIKKVYPDIPISFFSKDINYDLKGLYEYIDILSFSSGVRMKDYLKILPKKLIFQGNLDPIKLLVGGTAMKESVLKILRDMEGKDFIFNLGHGILPQTPRKNVEECISLVKGFTN